MKIISMLSYHDEDPQMLRELRDSLEDLPDVLIAVEGAYDLYPDQDRKFSLAEQMNVLSIGQFHARFYGENDWSGNEVEKRQFMLERALEIADADDWLMVVDSDYLIREIPLGFKLALRGTTKHAAHIAFFEGLDLKGAPAAYPMRMFMRAEQGMYMDGNHYTYRVSEDRHHHILGRDSTIPHMNCMFAPRKFLVEHRVHQRDPERRASQTIFYEARDQGEIES